MRVEFQIVEVEHMARRKAGVPAIDGTANHYTSLGGALEYRQTVPIDKLKSESESLIGTDADTAHIRSTWQRLANDGALVPSGEIYLSNVIAFGNEDLLLHAESGVCLAGATVNWGAEYCRQYIDANLRHLEGFTWIGNREGFRIDLPTITVDDRYVALMGSPGYDIYGHWLIDYIPRLFLDSMRPERPVDRYLFPDLKEWALELLSTTHVAPQCEFKDSKSKFRKYSDCYLPSGTKNGFRLSNPACRLAWLALRDNYRRRLRRARSLNRSAKDPKIYISRKNVRSTREFENAAQLEQIAINRGYTIVTPEALSIVDQVDMFQDARLIVGEDGSGLHNIIFTEPGATLGVINSHDRINLWHLGLCETLGHRISYILSKPIGEDERQRYVDEAMFNNFLDGVENAA